VHPGLKVLYISGYPEDTDLDQLPGPFLAKPFAVAELLAAVRGVLDASPAG